MNYKDKLIDNINRLFDAGYNSDYPPLREMLDELDAIYAREEYWAHMNEYC